MNFMSFKPSSFGFLVVLFLWATLFPVASFSQGNENHPMVSDKIYPQKNSNKITMGFEEYHKLYLSMNRYIGSRFIVRDQQCLGGQVGLTDEVNSLFEVNSQSAGSIDPGVFFVWGIMRHGGSCQTALVFSKQMKVNLVATYRGGVADGEGKDNEPSVLSIYVRNPDSLRYLPVLRRWASVETKSFSEADNLSPRTYETRIYDLNCSTSGDRIDVDACRMDPPHQAKSR